MTTEIDQLVSDFSRFYILTILYECPCHGYDIISKFKDRIGKPVSPSLVYPFLQQLERKSLLRHKTVMSGAKKRKVFQLTPEGKALTEQLFRRFSTLVSAAIEPSLKICANCGCKIFEGGYQEVIDDQRMSFCCVHCAGSYKKDRKKP